MSSLTAQPAIARSSVMITGAGGGSAEVSTWGIAVESPVQIALNGTPWTVMMASPCDLEDLAIGLAISERVLRDVRAATDVTVAGFLNDITVDLIVAEDQLDRRTWRARALIGSTACGLCGLESLADLQQRPRTRRSHVGDAPITDAAILAAFSALPSHQPINHATHSVHAAAWCEPTGTILLVREDVGRHNALDKLLGALARQDMLESPGFIVMSSRCSYELVAKAVSANTMLLATVSAPTSMALEWSRALALPLVCRLGGSTDGRIVHFRREDDGAT
jgi:FdhD protein